MTLKTKLKQQSGGSCYGTMISEFHTPNLAVMLEASGFEFAIVDCEHGYFDFSMLANLVAAAGGRGLPLLVRVPQADREWIVKTLDMGIEGLVIPMAESAGQIRDAVKRAKYAPEGSRGVSTIRAHSGYRMADLQAYMRQANERTLLLAQIESLEGLAQLDEIAAVPGLDGLIVGPNDLSQELGTIGRNDAPELLAAIARIAEAAERNGLCSGIITSDTGLIRYCESLGMQLVSWSSDIGMLMSGAKQGLTALRGM